MQKMIIAITVADQGTAYFEYDPASALLPGGCSHTEVQRGEEFSFSFSLYLCVSVGDYFSFFLHASKTKLPKCATPTTQNRYSARSFVSKSMRLTVCAARSAC